MYSLVLIILKNKHMKYYVFILISLYTFFTHAQYTDYVGAGHDEGVSVTASSQQTRTDWNESALAENTVNGLGLDARLFETSRFLAQATIGADLSYIQTVSEADFEDWIDNQFTIPVNPGSLGEFTTEVYEEAKQLYYDNGGTANYSGPNYRHFQYAWWEINTGNEDLLRQRVALALSEIFSFSHNFTNEVWGEGSGYFWDVLQNNAFSNYKDLLMDITLQPMMGMFLTYYNNPKSNPSQNQFPDENYAREVMQLFTIGLDELNQDGTYILDGNGDRIPTYDNYDIGEFAKVFTGLSAGETTIGIPAEFGFEFNIAHKGVPLAMYEPYHEQGAKYLLNGYVIPAGQDGMQDIEDAITHLFNHPNTAPFVAYRLIQRLVKSNPSPAYVSSVSSAFNNTNGVRGDMKAVIKAILLHPEARSCSWASHAHQGKLREPMIRYYNLVHQLATNNPSGYPWNSGDKFMYYTYQAPLSAFDIFNFFYPDFPPNGPIADAGLVGPEFQINDSYTCIGYVNRFDSYIRLQGPLFDPYDLEPLGIEDTTIDFTYMQYLAKESEVLINYLDKLFTHGQLSIESRQIIKTAVETFPATDNASLLERAKMAVWLVLVSPDYVIIK